MTDLRKAAEMALDALEFNDPLVEDFGSKEQLKSHNEAIAALYEALRQGEQKTVHFLANGVRYKVTHQGYYGCSIVGLPENLNGQWVALVEATDSKHLNCIALQESTKPEQATIESVYETIVKWDEGGGKRSRRELARRIVELYTALHSAKGSADSAKTFGKPDIGLPDPCPQCRKGGVCRTPKCGRLQLPAEHPYRNQALAQPEQSAEIKKGLSMNHASMKHLLNLIKNGWIESAQELIESALAQPEQEPVAIIDDDGFAWGYGIEGGKLPSGTKVYTAPPKHEWQGLASEELDEINGSPMRLEHSCLVKFARDIENKLREKNG